MKLLFDHNLPPLLVSRLANLFPHSQHVFALGLDRASDWEIRDYARQNGYAIVTKDADFSELCVLLGFPPKIIWIRRGNCSTTALEELLRQQCDDIEALDEDPTNGVLTLF
jgi:predicted nuclease of predicted toxin-antitoxin system